MSEQVLIIGAGGHAKVIADIILHCGDRLLGFLDDKIHGTMLGYPVLGGISEWKKRDDALFIIGIGSYQVRKSIAQELNAVNWYTAIHPRAYVGLQTKIGPGSVVMANATVNPSVCIGMHAIINTGAVVEHDCVVEDYAHISPNATLCGTVHVGAGTQIGAGATIRNNINICGGSTIGAGCVVTRDIVEQGTYIGVPARKIYEKDMDI